MNNSDLELFAQEFLEENYGLSLEIPVVIGKVNKTALAAYCFNRSSNGTPVNQTIIMSDVMVANNSDEVVKDLLSHELVHYALHTLGEEFNDGSVNFESELLRLNISSSFRPKRFKVIMPTKKSFIQKLVNLF